MNILAINTAQKIGQISLRTNNMVSNIFLTEAKSFSENLLVKIDEILKQNKLTINDIDVISVVCGPGSFTGTRISIALVKGIKCVLKQLKIIELSVFDVIREKTQQSNCILLEDSGVGDFYYAIVKNNLVEKIDADNLENIKKLGLDLFFDEENNVDALMNATIKKIESNQFCELENLEPIYVKASQAQREMKKKFENEIIVENLNNENIIDVLEIENECFLNEKYSKKIFENELKNERALYLIAKIKNAIVGYIGVSFVENEAEILKIAVKQNYAQMGIGTKLIENIINKLSNVKKIYLEVNEKNVVAQKFYAKLNFKICGKRKNYYGKNENAILMERCLK